MSCVKRRQLVVGELVIEETSSTSGLVASQRPNNQSFSLSFCDFPCNSMRGGQSLAFSRVVGSLSKHTVGLSVDLPSQKQFLDDYGLQRVVDRAN